MNRQQQLIAGVVVLLGLGGAVYKVSQDDQKKGFTSTTSADLPKIETTDDVDKIVITNADKPEVVLEKQGEKWVMTKPVESAANQQNVKSLLDNVKDLKVKEAIYAQPTEESKTENNFGAGKAVHVVTYKGSDKKLDASFGKSGARGQLAMIEGQPGIYAVSGYSSYLFAREVKGWRDTEIFKFDDANASAMTIENDKGVFSFTKGEKDWAGTFKGKPIPNFDEAKVKDALRAFKSLSADDFGDGKSAADTGLDKPAAKVTVNLKDNAGTFVLNVGKTSQGTSRFAQKNGSDVVYTISSYAADWANADVSKFQRVDGGAPKPGAMPPGMGGMPGMPHGMPGMGGDDDEH